jgi:predicted HTH domain antitoxin
MTIFLPDSISESEARLLLAIKLFEEERVSSGKAAEIAGCSKEEFMKSLSRRGTTPFNQPPEELDTDLGNA